ncbi:hypothetical protein HPP92_014167 [Vanilla planifolia]|uniref:Uncharacterized protein n=1 Tax=Vanilla planifolia TaxID=51239 RepID=A0A835UZA8_VANPL|nr:hypothetical protein HPP92_014167 [Vanilla planifolia]
MKYMKLGSKPSTFQWDGNNIRFVTTELETDIIIKVGDVKFYLHKFPILSKSQRLNRLLSTIDDEDKDEIDITDIPGGPAAFEICAKFCYGMIATLNAYNVVAARCAAEYLEMHETVEKGNLVYKIDVFLNTSVLRSWKDSIIALQTTKALQPWSEDLKVVSCCIDSIACKASIDPEEVEWSYTYNRKKLPSENGLDPYWNGVRKQQSVPKDWWVEDLCELDMESYKQVFMAIETKGSASCQVLGESLKAYACRRLPGFTKCTSTNGGDFTKYQALLETIVWLLPREIGSISCSFLFKLLKSALLLSCGENCRKQLIKRIGQQLQDASVSDLIIPAPVGENTLYDLDTIYCILEEFFMWEDNSSHRQERKNSSLASASGRSKAAVSKLVVDFLGEAAKDPELPLSKFAELAEMVSGWVAASHDGLYHAIDMFLKGHPFLTKNEKKKVCNLMDCSKLSADASLHAVQNDRLPLRTVVRVLFFEQFRRSSAGRVESGLPSGVVDSFIHQDGGAASRGSSSPLRRPTPPRTSGTAPPRCRFPQELERRK